MLRFALSLRVWIGPGMVFLGVNCKCDQSIRHWSLFWGWVLLGWVWNQTETELAIGATFHVSV